MAGHASVTQQAGQSCLTSKKPHTPMGLRALEPATGVRGGNRTHYRTVAAEALTVRPTQYRSLTEFGGQYCNRP